MSHEMSHKQMNLGEIRDNNHHRVKDSLLLAIVFFIGLLGTCYILHVALSNEPATGYHLDEPSPGSYYEAEAIYVTDGSH